jgi:dTDP-4-dehydrorhamnose 3,5-epimerase
MGLILKEEFLGGLKVFEPAVYFDERGFFMESFRADEFVAAGLSTVFPQDNHSNSAKDVFRGLHFQWNKPQGKLIRVTRGAALFVELDIRHDSSTLGKHVKIELNEENKKVLWVPPGFANGFLALENNTDVLYKCTAVWNGKAEGTIRWNDPSLGIALDTENPLMSDKDRKAQTLVEWLHRPESKIFCIKKRDKQ